MTYDAQGQGDSDLFGADCPGTCSGVPYQRDYNFYQGAEDSLNFFFSGKNPVAWDNLSAITDCGGVAIPKRYRQKRLLNVPALGMTNDYMFNTTVATSAPDPDAKTAGFAQVSKAGLPSQIIALRGATHLTYSYIPLVFQANQLGERMASYYTKAWFDLFLRGERGGLVRLTASAFDGSADISSIGTGSYDPSLANPRDPYAGNVPYLIKGIRVRDAASFYYRSAWSLRDPKTGAKITCNDVREGCPGVR